MRRITFMLILLLSTVSPNRSSSQVSRIIDPPQPTEVPRLVYELYWIGKRKDTAQIEKVREALTHDHIKVSLMAWITLGRLETGYFTFEGERNIEFSPYAASAYQAVARARIHAAKTVPIVNTPAQLSRKVDAFLAYLGITIRELNELRKLIAELNKGPDTMDTPPARAIVLEGLCELVADAKLRGVDTAEIEKKILLFRVKLLPAHTGYGQTIDWS